VIHVPRRHAATPPRRHAATPPRRHAATPLRRPLAILCVLAALMMNGWSALAQPDPVRPIEREWLPGRLIVCARGPEFIGMMEGEIASMGLRVLHRSYTGERLALAVPVGHEQELRQFFKASDWAEWVIQDFSGRGGTFTPPPSEMPAPTTGTPHPHDLWFLENTGQTITNSNSVTLTGTPGADINVLQAWTRTQGDPNVLVAVLDSGIDYAHPEFQGRIYAHDINNVCQSNTPPFCPLQWPTMTTWCLPTPGITDGATDNFGHGTQVASVLAASADNGVPTTLDGAQFAGVDPGCTLVSARAGYANGYYFSEYLNAMEEFWLNPLFEDVRVINISFLGYDCPNPYTDEHTAFTDLENMLWALHNRGVFIVTITGNDPSGSNQGVNLQCPNIWPYVVMVGATTNQDGWAVFSRRSPYIDFVAPGWGMYVAQWDHPCDLGIQYSDGTSLAAPVVAGIASLLYARADQLGITLSSAMVYECLKEGAVRLGSPPYPNDEFGWGRVDAYESLMKLEELYYVCDADVTSGNTSGQFGYGVPDGDVDADDYGYFFQQWLLGNVAVADIASSCSACAQPGCSTSDGLVTGDDLVAYTCLYSAGCP
jgi:subtilisin family serine protease